MTDIKNTECCPRFDPTPWDNKTLKWENKKFIRDHVRTLFFMPLNFGQVIGRMMQKIEAAGGKTVENLGLSDHTSKWNMDILVAVDKEIPGAQNTTLSGEFFAKVYEGDFKDTGKWCADYEQILKGQGKTLKKMYMWYTTCPACAKKYGKNYTVIIGQV